MAQPEAPGPYQYAEWNAGAVQPGVNVFVYYPTNAPGPGGLVAVQHGGGEGIGQPHKLKSELLASRGFVAFTPVFSDLLLNPSPSHGQTINAIFEWLVQQAQTPGSQVAGKVDGSRRGAMGHSYGGWAVLYAAQQSPQITALVAYDAVGDLSLASSINGPSLHLLAAAGNCGGGSTQGYGAAPGPKLLATVTGSSHCDVGNQGTLCPIACGGSWNAAASTVFHRYGVAFLSCVLGGADAASMQGYVGGAEWQGDPGLTSKQQEGNITCAAGGGAGGTGAGGVGGSGALGGTGGASGGVGGSGALGGTGGGVGGAGAVAGTGGAGNQPGCTAPDCSACTGCYDFCLCDTGNADFCVQACGAPPAGGSAGSQGAPDGAAGDEGGCGCRGAGARSGAAAAWLAVALALVTAGRRRAASR